MRRSLQCNDWLVTLAPGVETYACSIILPARLPVERAVVGRSLVSVVFVWCRSGSECDSWLARVRGGAACKDEQVAAAEVLGGLFVWLRQVPVLSAVDRMGELVCTFVVVRPTRVLATLLGGSRAGLLFLSERFSTTRTGLAPAA